MNEIPGRRASGKLASFAPAYLACAGEDVSDRLLVPMMMNSGPRSRLDLEQAAPDRGRDADFRRNGGSAFRARRLCRSAVKLTRTDDVNSRRCAHGVTVTFRKR